MTGRVKHSTSMQDVMIPNTTLTIPSRSQQNSSKGEDNYNILTCYPEQLNISKLDDGLVSVSTESSSVDILADNYSMQPFQVIHTFHNESDYDVVVVNRNNIPFTIPRSTSRRGFGRKQHFGVRTTIVVRGNNYINDFHHQLKTAAVTLPLTSANLKKLESDVREALENNPHVNHYHLAFDSVVDVEQFGDNDIYLTDTDYLLVGAKDFGKSAHPFSEDKKTQRYLQQCVGPREVAGVLVEIVDNQRVMTKRYMNVGNSVVEIPVVIDPQRKDGVYRSLFTYELGVNKTNKIDCYKFEEADEIIGLYKTKEEALAGGDIEAKYKLALKDKERELTQLKHEFEQRRLERTEDIDERKFIREIEKLKEEARALKKSNKLEAKKHKLERKKHEREMSKLETQLENEKIKLEQERARHEQEERKLRYEIEKFEYERENLRREFIIKAQDDFYHGRKTARNDEYEERSFIRKESIDWLKLMPAVITGTAAVGGAMYAISRLR